jgi:hypothetical protein
MDADLLDIPAFLRREADNSLPSWSAGDDYLDFLNAKVALAPSQGIEVDASEVNPALKPHIKIVVPWMLKGGRRAFFGRFGLQKTTAHLECMRLVMKRTKGPTLIVLPLGARLSFFHDAERYFRGEFAVTVKFIRSNDEIDPAAINITNFESVREGKVTPSLFTGASLDEGDILKSFGGTKTFREFMRLFETVPYRFVATATPDPNEYIELLAYAAWLGVMDVGQAKTRFFKRDSEKADKLSIHPHKEKEFWLWVASWALFLQKPSDLDPSLSDEGYDLPPLDIRWHEIPADHAQVSAERDGQLRLLRGDAVGLTEAAREKRDSLDARIAKMKELRAELPEAHRILWHDLEAERHAIEREIPSATTVYGSQPLEEREEFLIQFAEGEIDELAGKPMMIGSGPNFQHHCWWAIFLGIGFKFKELIQAIHRVQRYGQTFKDYPEGREHRVRIDLIYTEREREVRRNIEDKWKRYDEQAVRMATIIRELGLAQAAIAGALVRTMGVERQEVTGESFTCVHNDCVAETRQMAENSVGLIITSIPFSTQYEYSPSYNDFGHTDDDAHFFRQMDFLTPQLLRVLQPGRVAAIHCKDRIMPGGMTGLGFQTVSPFGWRTLDHFMKHGFAYVGTKFIGTDVVRENNQTYRLGWTEQCKDGSRQGAGLCEYLHIFRKPQTDRTKGYADLPVVKDKPLCFVEGGEGETQAFDRAKRPVPGTGYSRGRWQLDANGTARSDGNRLLLPHELRQLVASAKHDDKSPIYRGWKEWCETKPYDFETHVAFCEELDRMNMLPPDFALTPPHSIHPDIWTDITRMRTLNGRQHAKGKEMHLCPLQFDIVDRAIVQYSMPAELVFDPFGGLMTVPYCAIGKGRRGYGVELSHGYFTDGVYWCREKEQGRNAATLFDLMGARGEAA